MLVKELSAIHNLNPLFQCFWTLRQSPTGSMWKKKVVFSSQTSLLQKSRLQKKLHSRSDHKPLRLSRPQVPGVILEFERKRKSLAGWSPQMSSQHHELQTALSKHVSLVVSVEEIQQVLQMVMGDVSREGECRACGPMTGVEHRFDDARSRLRDLTIDCSAGLKQLEPW